MNVNENQHTSEQELAQKQHKPVVIYDLECVLCNFWVKMLLWFDRWGQLRFAHAGSLFVKELMIVWPDLNPSDGVMLWEQGNMYQGMEAVLRIAAVVGGVLRVVAVLRLLPKQIREKLYNRVARNRYDWFGKREPVCDLSMQKYSDRFLP